MGLIILVVTFGLMYVLLILPQQRRVKAQQAMIQRVEEGDEVMTTSGIYGTVVELDGDVLYLEVADGIELKMARAAISRIVEPTESAEPAPPEITDGGVDDGADAS